MSRAYSPDCPDQRGDLQHQAVLLPATALDPETTDAAADRLIRRGDPSAFLNILETLVLAVPARPRDAKDAAEGLARAARLVRQVVIDQCRLGAPADLDAVRAEFRETLFAHPAAGGYDTGDEDTLFGNAFAQTLAFGLLLAREAGGGEVDRDAYRALPNGAFPLLRATLRALTQDEILDLLGAAFDVLQAVVNNTDTDLLKPRGRRDPILYFYEDFLEVFDPDARRKHGVFFTPVPVVHFMVAATEAALRDGLGTNGLLDPKVLLLDPACGTGTFLIAAASVAAERVRATYGEGALAAEMQALAGRLHGFELLVGPYTVAHYRMLREVAASGALPTERLPIFLADTLAPPGGALGVTPRLGLLAGPIIEERRAADALKRDKPILAIFGNPPYRRLAEGEEEGVISGWDNGFWQDLKDPVRAAGWGGELNTFPELSVAFWRWCLWKLFESDGAPGRGVVCLITNRTFLAGHPYAGLRQMMRRRFDDIAIIDLRGDARGARPAGIEVDQNVFEVQVGVCIVIATATGKRRRKGAQANIRYADVWRHDAFTAAEKEALLTRAETDPVALSYVPIMGTDLADFVPQGFAGLDWPSLPEVFVYRGYGAKTQHDSIAYATQRGSLLSNLQIFKIERDVDHARTMFKDSRKNKTEAAQATQIEPAAIREISFRPMDRRWLYYHPSFVDEMARNSNAAWGAENVCLYALPAGTGTGPGVCIHGLMPDYHAFRGSYGGYAFPLWDRRAGPNAHNLNPRLLAGLCAVYGSNVTPQAVFDAVAGLLSATSYTRRFGADLEESFPHVPFPASLPVFRRAAAIGAKIREIEGFAREPAAEFRIARLVGRATGVTLQVPAPRDALQLEGAGTGFIRLQNDHSLRLAGVSPGVWEFAVSGYRVLYRWLKARDGEALADVQRPILDLVWRIEELLHWCDEADAVLADAIACSLTRGLLGTAGAEAANSLYADDEQRDSTA